jgi:hypothetical protein
MLEQIYRPIARTVVEHLFDAQLDLDRFVPALYKEMQSRVATIKSSADDYEPDELNWAADQEREAKLFLDGLADAIAELEVAYKYAIPGTDALTLEHVVKAAVTLRNLKLRMEA